MPPIQPSGGLQTKTYTVTSADLLNAIVIPLFQCNFFEAYLEPDSLYDGETLLEAQNESNTFDLVCDGATTKDFATGIFSKSVGAWVQNGLANGTKYPFQIHAKINIKATQGTCKIVINYL